MSLPIDTFFLNEGILGILPRNPSPENPDLSPVPASILSRCLSKKLEMSSTRVILGSFDSSLLESVILFALLLELFDVDGTFECCKYKQN